MKIHLMAMTVLAAGLAASAATADEKPIKIALVADKTGALEAYAKQTSADFALIAVHLRGVEMPIAELQRRLDQIDAQILLQRHSAETEHWNARAVRFNDVHS